MIEAKETFVGVTTISSERFAELVVKENLLERVKDIVEKEPYPWIEIRSLLGIEKEDED